MAEPTLKAINRKLFNPVCFSDDDSEKYYLKIAQMDILPFEVAVMRYPDALVCFTPLASQQSDIINELILCGKFNKERIVGISTLLDLGYKDGCRYIVENNTCYNFEVSCCIMGFNLISCCSLYLNQLPGINVLNYENYHKAVDDFLLIRKNAINDMNVKRWELCNSYRNLSNKSSKEPPLIRNINLCGDGGRCQLRCVYCNVNNNVENCVNFKELFNVFINNSCIDEKNLVIHISQGEPALYMEDYDLLDILKPYPICFWTNAVAFSKKMAVMLTYPGNESGKSRLIISLDAGTDDTFFRIKGVDCFKTVKQNIRRYREYTTESSQICLKYVFVDTINDNEVDIVEFIKFCAETQSVCVISRDFTNVSRLSDHAIDMVKRCIVECIRSGCSYYVITKNFRCDELIHLGERIPVFGA